MKNGPIRAAHAGISADRQDTPELQALARDKVSGAVPLQAVGGKPRHHNLLGAKYARHKQHFMELCATHPLVHRLPLLALQSSLLLVPCSIITSHHQAGALCKNGIDQR
jgi:hypothetical protein